MPKNRGQFFTKETTEVEELERGIPHWFSRPDITGSEGLFVTRIDVQPRSGDSFHFHPTMEEVIYVLSGEAEQWIE